ncbi:PAS domain-containing sensor histidine kinase [Melittangium boletus]|uniref:PAS domain-containing sensor histidine kinase n=1 Tax=Melittangium boletus TaxID=83453 RepID=UPI003DA337DE
MKAGGLENATSIESLSSLEPYGMVVLRRALGAEHPLLDAEWVTSNPAARHMMPGAEAFQGLSVRDISTTQGEEFTRMVLRWEKLLEQQAQLSEDVSYVVGAQRIVFRADVLQSAEHLVVWLRDITAEREELEALRRSRDLFQRVIHCASDAIFAKDLQGRYTLINPAGARFLGLRPEDVIGRTDEELFPPDDAQATRARDQAVFEAGQALTYEDRAMGGLRTWQSTKGVLRDETGAITGLFGISRDITARQRMEQALRESEARFRLVARATRDVLWDRDLSTGEMHWSTSLGVVFGEAPRQGMASWAWWRERIHPEDLDRELRTLHAVMSGAEDSWSNEYRFRRADGGYAFVLERGYISRDPDGLPERLIATMMDVSERKQREERQAHEARMVERFMGVVGHDLGSPLAAIRISSQMLQQAPNLAPRQRTALGRIEESAQRVSRMTRQLLDGVLARNGGLSIQPGPMDLEPVCQRVIAELGTVYPGRVVQLSARGDTQGTWDADRLAQVLSNLLGNALEHGDAAHPIRLQLWDEAGVQRLEVNNQGGPIDPALLPHLFEPFRQGGGPRKHHPSGGGLGLGLYIVRELVRAHGGDVGIHSTAERGTTFALTLPRHAPEPIPEPIPG